MTRLASVAILAFASACSSSGGSTTPPEQTGQTCNAPEQCYPGLDAGALRGAPQCLTRVSGGYCTHLCTTDADCCAVPGECKTGFKQVCAPFESTGQMMCFLSCEDVDLAASDAGITDSTVYCHDFSNAAFSCRSTGGGKANRKVCVP